MRPILCLALATVLACDGGGDDTADDTGGDTSDSDTSDTGTDTGDTGTDTGDTDTGDTWPTPDADFLANGPGEGLLWAVVDPNYGDNDCGVGSQNSLDWPGADETTDVQSVSTSLGEFGLALQAVNTPGTNVCEWANDGTFTCDTETFVQNLSGFGIDAVVTSTITATGRFRAREGTDPMNSQPHSYGTRWAADVDYVYTRTCTGSECSEAAAGSGATSFPCTTEFTMETVNYEDPTLSNPR